MSKRSNSSLMLRDLLGITQQQLADLLHVSREQISKVENEMRGLSTELLSKTGHLERMIYYSGKMLPMAETLDSEEFELQEIESFKRKELVKVTTQMEKLRAQLLQMEEQHQHAKNTVHMIRAYFLTDKPNMEVAFSRQLLAFEATAAERMKKSGKLAQYKVALQLELNIKIAATLAIPLKR